MFLFYIRHMDRSNMYGTYTIIEKIRMQELRDEY